MIDYKEKNYNKEDIGNSNYLLALQSLQSWLEENGVPFEEMYEIEIHQNLQYEEKKVEELY